MDLRVWSGKQGRQRAVLCKGPVAAGSRVVCRCGTGEAAGVWEQTPGPHGVRKGGPMSISLGKVLPRGRGREMSACLQASGPGCVPVHLCVRVCVHVLCMCVCVAACIRGPVSTDCLSAPSSPSTTCDYRWIPPVRACRAGIWARSFWWWGSRCPQGDGRHPGLPTGLLVAGAISFPGVQCCAFPVEGAAGTWQREGAPAFPRLCLGGRCWLGTGRGSAQHQVHDAGPNDSLGRGPFQLTPGGPYGVRHHLRDLWHPRGCGIRAPFSG